MQELELDRINANSPYIVELDFSTGLFKFVSDFGVSFSVAFEKDEFVEINVLRHVIRFNAFCL